MYFQMNKDSIKKLVKYVLMLLVATFAVISIPKNQILRKEALLVGLTVASVFVVLDLVMPSICLQ